MSIKEAFICGHPVKHSRSPLLHGYWIKKHNIEGRYGKKDIEPENIKSFLKSLKEKKLVGGNVTIPHKEAAFEAVDKLDGAATKIGAVNTVWFEGDKLVGGNTDAHGFTANLDQHAKGWDENPEKKTAIVFGAGGASRAVLYSLIERKISKIYLINRTIEKANKLAKEFGPTVIPLKISEAESALNQADIFINSTSIGMKPDDKYPFELAMLKSTALVTDLVYTPLDTVLIIEAKKAGLKTVDGLGMLLHQAVPGFEKWFGIKPKVTDELRQLIVDDL
ncbi:MAG: shikimate dehydrogenase [Rhizobiales bacterium]|nr:shikimate dehydrogenase [Hyphomicrobiales bacterium]